jgi:hypothetical protein
VSDSLRYARQMLLVEIGENGQRLLEAATADLGGVGLDHEVAEAYARRAGIGSVAQGTIEGALAPSFLENPAARAVVAGSRAALSAVRAALAPQEVP